MECEMHIFGICGGSGSGKGTACAFFSELGIPSIDTDKVYREMTAGKSDCLDELVDAFGPDVLLPNGSLDRRRLAAIVFADTEDGLALKGKLEAITHKHILKKTRDLIRDYEEEGAPAVLIDAPLLFESRFNEECEKTIAVIASEGTRIKRIMQRDSISEEAARARILSQIPDDTLVKTCDYVIRNDGSTDQLRCEVQKLFGALLNEKII